MWQSNPRRRVAIVLDATLYLVLGFGHNTDSSARFQRLDGIEVTALIASTSFLQREWNWDEWNWKRRYPDGPSFPCRVGVP